MKKARQGELPGDPGADFADVVPLRKVTVTLALGRSMTTSSPF